MKKRIVTLLMALCCMALLAGCFCQHEVWKDATCLEPKTCADCGKTEGEALGHVWMAATCEAPKTCEQCGQTEGEAKGHDWVDATCTEAKHCTRCTLTEGEALGHDWVDATTELPQTCARCAVTEGEKIITDPRFTTASTIDLQGKWVCDIPMTGEMLGYPALEEPLVMQYFVEFCNNGEMKMYALMADDNAFLDFVVQMSVDQTYAELAAQGFSQTETDAAFVEIYGMDVEDYLRAAMAEFSINELMADIIGAIDVSGIYYVEDGILYTGMAWAGAMTEDEYVLEGDSLTIPSLSESVGMELSLTRVVE